MSKRIEGENLPSEMLVVFKEKAAESSGQLSIKPTVLFESLVEKFWDFDADDFRTSTSWLIANGLLYLNSEGSLVLTPQGSQAATAHG